jgi:rhodanese-related sulfurtransferase
VPAAEAILPGMHTTDIALDHFTRRLAVETDVSDVAAARDGLVLIDARSPEAYEAGHLPGAINLPHATIDEEAVAALPDGQLVAYCWGPACNGAVKACRRLAELGRPAKEMLGGFEYWQRDGHPVEAR